MRALHTYTAWVVLVLSAMFVVVALIGVVANGGTGWFAPLLGLPFLAAASYGLLTQRDFFSGSAGGVS